jgi:hypothetical protein
MTPSTDDPAEYAQLAPEVQAQLLDWIKHTYRPALRVNARSSYGLKHDFSTATGIYVTNGQFKGAMQAAGYAPIDATERNWRFLIAQQHGAT